MAVLINLEKPENCSECLLCHRFGNVVHYCFLSDKNAHPIQAKKKWCPLVPVEEATICGYPLRNLVAFAVACVKNNVDEHDLKEFANNAEFAIKCIVDEQKKVFERALEKLMQEVQG